MPHLKIAYRSHPACISGSKQHIGDPNFDPNTCIGIYLWTSPVPVLNYTSKNVRFVILWYKVSLQHDWRNNHNSVQTNIITTEFDIRKHFRDSFFVVSIKINSFTTLACYTICYAVKICQITGLIGYNVRQCSSLFLENIFHQAGFIVRIPRATWKWFWKFLVINNAISIISCIWVGSSVQRFLSLAFIENSKSYRSGTATST